jgi:hypothetical protein
MVVAAAMFSASLVLVPCPARLMLPDHIRPRTCAMAAVTASALGRSPTFRRMVDRIGRLKGIVYIIPSAYVEPGTRRVLPGALLQRVTWAGDHRVLYVLVKPESGDRPAITMAHELHHVLEVLEAGAACDSDVEAYFARMGSRTSAWVVETPGAADVERQVRRELGAR